MLTRRTFLSLAALAPVVMNASPGAAQADRRNSLDTIIGAVPALPSGAANWPMQILRYADIGSYLAQNGLEPFPDQLTDDDTPKLIGLSRLPLDDRIFSYALAADWQALIGISIGDISQTLNAFDPPETVRAFTGAFSRDRIANAFDALDYADASTADLLVRSNPDSESLDPAIELQRIGVGAFNFIIATDELFVALRNEDQFEQCLKVMTGDDDSLEDNWSTFGMASATRGLTGYSVFPGSMLAERNQRLATQDAGDLLPPAVLFAGGIVFSGPDATAQYLVEFGDHDAATAAVPIVEDRIRSGISMSRYTYEELLGETTVEALDDTGVVRVTCSNPEMPLRWERMISQFDLGFLATE